MKRLLTILFLISFCFGQGFFYHVLDEVKFYVGTLAKPSPKIQVLNGSQLIISYAGSDGGKMILASYSYAADYTLTKQDTLYHAVGTYETPLARINDTHIFVYQGKVGDSHAKTYSVNGAGAFTKIDSIKTYKAGNYNSVAAISSTVFAAIAGKANTAEYLTTYELDGSYLITETDGFTLDANGMGTYNQIFALDADHFVVFWRDKDYDVGMQTGSYDGNWAATMIGSELEVNFSGIGASSVLMNETVAIVISNTIASRTAATYYVVEWDADFTNIGLTDDLGGRVMNDGFPALHRYNDTTVISLTGDTGNSSAIESFVLDGGNQITANNDRAVWHPAGNVSPDDIWVSAFDDSTIVAVYKDTDNDMWMTTIRISLTADDPIFETGWSHKIMGVETPTAVNSASDFTKVSGVE